MRRPEREIKEREEVDSLLERCGTGHIGMAGPDGPYVVPMNFHYDRTKGRIYVHCASTGMKIDVLRTDPRVCFEACEIGVPDDPEDPRCPEWWRSVIAFGNAVLLDDVDEKLVTLNCLIGKYGKSHKPASREQAEKTTIIGIDIERVTGKFYGTSECPRKD